MLDQVCQENGGARISADEIIAGNFDSVRAAFDHHGLDFDENIARACVDQKKWHFRSQ